MQTLLNLNKLILLLALTINFGLAFYILFKNHKSPVNRAFSMVLFLIAYWTLTFLIFSTSRNPVWVLFWRRLTPTGSALLAGYFLYFTLVFPKKTKNYNLFQRFLMLAPGFFFAFASVFTPFMIKSFVIQDGTPIFGPLYALYALYMLLYFVIALAVLSRKFFMSKSYEKLQVFYVLVGMAFSITVGLFLSLLLPIFGVSQLFSLGPLFTLIMAAFIAYAIIKHKLLGIEDFLSRGILWLAVICALIIAVFFVSINDLRLLLPAYAVLAVITIGIYVLFQNAKSKINISFFATTFFAGLWVFAVQMSLESTGNVGLVFWSKMAAVFSPFIMAHFLYFCFVFPKENQDGGEKRRFVLFVPPLLLALFTVFNLVVQGAVDSKIIYGPAFPLMAAYFVSYMLYAFYSLLRKQASSRGVAKTQIRYLFLAFLIGMIPPVLTNLILPLFGYSEFRFLVPAFIVMPFFIIAYAIIKHRLMSIDVVIQRSAVYGIVTLLIMTIYALAVIISETFLRQVTGYSSLLITAFAALIIAIAYQPLVRFFQKLSDQIFFRGRYDYRKTLQQISQKIASVIELRELTQLIVSSFIDTMRVSEISFLLLDKEKEHFRAVGLNLERYKKIEIDVDSAIISWLCSSKDILVRDEIEEEIDRQEALVNAAEEKRKGLEEVKDEMERLGISVWVPIISKEEMIGIIALGNKLSGEIFSSEDLGLLSTLGSQTAVALDNARLYNEVVNMKDYSEEILRSMVDGVLTVDTRGRVVTYNLMAEKITGRKFAEVIGKTCEEIWGKRGTVTRVIENTLHDHSSTNFDTGIASPEKGLVPVSISSTVLKDHEGKKIGALMTIIDMTEVKQLEGKVRRADKLTALATMAAGMAHEIKNPLSSMKVLSQLLPLRYEDKEYRGKLEEILPREINRIDRIVENLLGFARATAPHFEKVDINKFLEQIIADFSDQAKAVEVEIIKEFADLPQIEMDKGQMSQVFSNLILNAIQAMRTGGTLKVKIMPGKKVDQIMQNIKVQISDTGHGISEEGVKKLFDPFYTTTYGGTGLGLTITHSIVDGHKGYIDVESKPGKGTTFTITLPVSQGLL